MTQIARLLLMAAGFACAVPMANAASNPYPGRPSNAPINADSAFEPALECMDELLSRSSRDAAGVPLVPFGIADPTQKGGFTRDMIINAATRMSQRSHFFAIVIDPQVAKPDRFLQTGGSVTAFENGVESKDSGAGVSIASAVGGTYKSSNTLSSISVSLFFLAPNQVMVDGSFHTHTLYIRSQSKNAFFSSFLQVLGGSLSFGGSQSDGPQAGVKALIDLSMIEAVGNYAQVPYATCLARVLGTGEEKTDFKEFSRMKPVQQRSLVLAELTRRGLAAENASAGELRQAIVGFQRSQGLTPNGEIDFELYQALNRLQGRTPPPNRADSGNPSIKVSGVPGPFAYGRGQLPMAAVGDKLAFQATVAEPAFVACYYTDADGNVSRVFPNRSRAAYRLMPGEILRIPSERDIYAIMPKRSDSTEWFTCFAGRDDLMDNLGTILPNTSLRPLDNVHSAKDLDDMVRAALPNIASDTLSYKVQ